MHTPVFLDHLPDIDTVLNQKSSEYRLRRNRSLIEMQLNPDIEWTSRTNCPACGQSISNSRSFSQTHLDFQRCTDCNTIYARKVPTQAALDEARLALTNPDQVADGSREFEFTSLLNWVTLTEARIDKQLSNILDLRFCTQAVGWEDAVARLSHGRNWTHFPLKKDTEAFGDIAAIIAETKPDAILLPAEMDRVAGPKILLSVIHENAQEGAVIFLASSCADGLEYELLGADSPSFVPLDRLTVFSIKGISQLAEQLGFNILEVATPGRLDALILAQYYQQSDEGLTPFWSSFFHNADKNRLRDLQILLQRSLKSGVLRLTLEIP